jgi:membrane-associated phospholipid phosphatase
LLKIMGWAYHGLTAYSIIAFVLLVAVYGPQRARSFTLTFLVVTVATCLIGPWLPALGPMVQYAPVLPELQHVKVEDGTWGVEPLLRMRAGLPQILSLQHLPGLTSVPSLHTAMGLIVIYCCRGKAWVLFPLILVNGLMIAATPIFGGHYFVDVLAGAAIAAAAIAIVAVVEARTLRSSVCARDGSSVQAAAVRAHR